MPYNEHLAERIREALADIPHLEEKKMFRGVTFMVNGKMCISVSGEEIMCRIDPAIQDEVMEKGNIREMIRLGKPMKGFMYVAAEDIKAKKALDYWISLCLDFDNYAKAFKKKN